MDWANWGGRYGRSKVDFYEVCAAQEALGPDLQNKNIHRGPRWTAVLIGPRAGSSALRPEDLEAAAEQAGLPPDQRGGGGLLECERLTEVEMIQYRPVVRQVSEVTHQYFAGRVSGLQDLLRTTASGRQGVEPSYMMMHLWRYLRRAIAGQLYASGFFTDRAPKEGVIALCYANDLGDLDALLR